MRESAQPLAEQPIDLFRGQFVGKPLQQLRIGAGLDAIVQRLERYAALGKLAFQVLVAVDVELGVVRKVGAEFHEQRPEVRVDAVEVVMVDHGLQRDNYDGRLPTIKLAKSGSRRVAGRELP